MDREADTDDLDEVVASPTALVRAIGDTVPHDPLLACFNELCEREVVRGLHGDILIEDVIGVPTMEEVLMLDRAAQRKLLEGEFTLLWPDEGHTLGRVREILSHMSVELAGIERMNDVKRKQHDETAVPTCAGTRCLKLLALEGIRRPSALLLLVGYASKIRIE